MQVDSVRQSLLVSLGLHSLILGAFWHHRDASIQSKQEHSSCSYELVQLSSARNRTAQAPKPKRSCPYSNTKPLARSVGDSGQSDERSPAGKSEPSLSASGQAVRNSYLSKVVSAIESRKFYPREARRKKLEGTVTVLFTINKDGTPTDIRIHCHCAHDVLNQAAVALLKSIRSFESLPPELGNRLELRVPIAFERI